MKHATQKATRHINQNEGLIFEKSSAGKAAWKLPPLDVPEVDPSTLLGASERKDLGNMPEVSEIEIIRHFTRLSTWNYAIDLGMYPLGSCTMKYNARAAHPPREGDLEHLHQSGAGSPHGQYLHGHLWQGGIARARQAQPG